MLLILSLFILLVSFESYIRNRSARFFNYRYRERTMTSRALLSQDHDRIQASLDILTRFNTEYLSRMKEGKKMNKTPRRVELERCSILKADGIKKEREELRQAVEIVTEHSSEVVLGIMADSGNSAIEVLRLWVGCLNLTRGLLKIVDESGNDADVDDLKSKPVYIKYNSTNSGDAYMKPYKSDGFTGVLFQPKVLHDPHAFRQYGDLPLYIFT